MMNSIYPYEYVLIVKRRKSCLGLGRVAAAIYVLPCCDH